MLNVLLHIALHTRYVGVPALCANIAVAYELQ